MKKMSVQQHVAGNMGTVSKLFILMLLAFTGWSNVASAQAISEGSSHSLYLKSDGTVWACGYNAYGQLGDGTNTSRFTAVQVSGLTGITAIAGGEFHSLFLKNDGTVWACGYNGYGQLGDGTTTTRDVAVQVSGLTGITAIAAGGHHSLFLKNDGTVWGCGQNGNGQLGDGTTTDRSTAVQVSGLTGITVIAGGISHSLFVKNDGTVWACGYNGSGQLGDLTTTQRNTPVQVLGLTDITAISVGQHHSLFLKNDGTAWGCGYNSTGQLGDGTTTTRTLAVQVSGLTGITAISTGISHSLFLKSDGTVWGCGYNGIGQLGDGSNTNRSTAVQVSGLTGITAIQGGGYNSLFLKNDGTVWGCGQNGSGQLGDGTTTQRNTVVQTKRLGDLTGITAAATGGLHSMFLHSDGTVWTSGYNDDGELGDGTINGKQIVVQVSGLTGITAIAGGTSHSLFLKNDGTVWACGYNGFGALGDGTTTARRNAVQVSGLTDIIAIAAGDGHSLFLKNDGTVWACGYNASGQLGDGSTTNRTNVVQVSGLTGITAISGGTYHSLFLKDDGNVWACGDNYFGALGDGTTTNRYNAVQVSLLTGITSIAGGYYYSLFLKNDGTAWACGQNTDGKMGNGTLTSASIAGQVGGLTDITAIAAGESHSMFLKNNGTVWACGYNGTGQLGDGTITQHLSVVQVSPSWVGSITGIATKKIHSLFVKDDGTAWACGWNAYGQLGDGTTTQRISAVQVLGFQGLNLGGALTVAITGAGPVCAGNNISLSSATGAGTWSTGNTTIATVDASGVVTGLAAGNAVITYSAIEGTATATVTVNALPAISFTGNGGPVCAGTDLTLTATATGAATVIYAWAGPNSYSDAGANKTITAATIAAGGTYTMIVTDGNGCKDTATTLATVNPLPVIGDAINNGPICANTTLTLGSAASGGTGALNYYWYGPNSFSQPGYNQSIPAASVAAGGTYTVIVTDINNCADTATTSATVNALPEAITGTMSVLAGNTVSLSSATAGGVWSSVSAAIATVDPSLGVVTGVTPGAAVISYTAGCSVTATVTVTGATNNIVCVGQSTTLDNGGVSGGTWISTSGSVANVGLHTGVATGVHAGNVIMYYFLPTGGFMTTTVTVQPLANTGGGGSVCQGQSITLTNTTPGGGTWSVADAGIATVTGSGVVTGTGSGVAVISFTSNGGCVATKNVTVNGAAAISGATEVCAGQTITLSSATPGGSWMTSSAAMATVTSAGVVRGVAAGSPRITYIASGCWTAMTVTVNALSATTGASSVCAGQTTTLVNNTPGGIWSSDNTAVATVTSGGVVTGVGSGSASIVLTSPAGCVAEHAITVAPGATVSGIAAVCKGQTTTLSADVSGGVWSSSSNAYATVSPGGVVTGVNAGTIRITYALSGCQTVTPLTVNQVLAITGASAACQNQPITLANTTPGGGVWSSDNTAIANVSNTGVVTAVAGGSVAISFTAVNGCVVSKTVTFNAGGTISGGTTVCIGQTINLSNDIAGGNWLSSSGAQAQVSAAGVVTGRAAGSPRITYIAPGGCWSSVTLTVGALSPITGGTPGICASSSMTLANATPFGGVWNSSNGAVALVSAGGVVSGTGVGVTTISFTANANGCVATRNVSVLACREAAPGTAPSVEDATVVSFDVQLFPNPNTGTFTLSGTVSGSEEMAVDVMNVVGQVIYSSKVKPEHGAINHRIELGNDLAGGTYLLRLNSAGGGKVFHFVIGH